MRVWWAIFPPTIITAPTSASALPNPANPVVISKCLVSYIIRVIDLIVLNLSDNMKSLYSAYMISIVCLLRAMIMGVTITNWAIIIALSVYSKLYADKGP